MTINENKYELTALRSTVITEIFYKESSNWLKLKSNTKKRIFCKSKIFLLLLVPGNLQAINPNLLRKLKKKYKFLFYLIFKFQKLLA